MNTEPRFRLVEAMANGRILTLEGEREAPEMRIDRATLVEQFGDGVLADPNGKLLVHHRVAQKLGGEVVGAVA